MAIAWEFWVCEFILLLGPLFSAGESVEERRWRVHPQELVPPFISDDPRKVYYTIPILLMVAGEVCLYFMIEYGSLTFFPLEYS